MALEWHTVNVPIAGGLDQSTDKRVVQVGRLLDAENARFDRRGALAKRHGFQPLTKVGIDQNSQPAEKGARGIFSTGTELCLIGDHELFAYSEEQDRWFVRGSVSPFVPKISPVFRSSKSHIMGDVARAGDYLLHVATAQEKEDNLGVIRSSLVHCVTDLEGNPVYEPGVLNEVIVDADRIHAPRAFFVGDSLCCAAIHDVSAGAPDLYVWEWKPSQQHTPMAYDGEVWTNQYTTQEGIRTYDVCGLRNGTQYVLAMAARTSNYIQLYLQSATHTQDDTQLITLPFTPQTRHTVAICESPTEDRLYVLTEGYNTDVLLYARKASDLTAVWGPITLYSEANTYVDFVYTAGIVAGQLDLYPTQETVTCVFDFQANGASRRCMNITVRTSDGAAIDTLYDGIYNVNLTSKPWIENGRAYFAAAVAGSPPFTGKWIFDAMAGDSDRTPRMVGALDVGIGATGREGGQQNLGSANSVVSLGNRRWAMASSSISASVVEDNYTDNSYASDLLTCDFGTAPLAATVFRGTAVIGGGVWTWYDGARCEEYGFMYPPYFVTPTAGADAGSILDGSYQYRTTWEKYDYRGIRHRSLPSAVSGTVTITLGEAAEAATLAAFKTIPSNTFRHSRAASVCVYRSPSTGLFTRITPPRYRIPNLELAVGTAGFVDDGNWTAWEPLYTDSGELEAVMPEGGRVPVVTSDRLFFVGLARRERFQYSKVYRPGTATEDLFLPETSEGFGRVLPSGSTAVAAAALDDKLVVFGPDDIHVLYGAGPDDAGGADDYELQPIMTDAGCVEARSVVGYPDGVIFQSRAGLCAIDRSLQVQFIGEAVSDLMAEYPIVTSAVKVARETQCRFTLTTADGTSGVVLVYDYSMGAWTYWTPRDATGARLAFVGACLHADTYHAVTKLSQVYRESATSWRDGQQWVPMRVTTAWLQAAQPQGWQRVRYVSAMCEQRDACGLTVTLHQGFDDATATQTKAWTTAEVAAWPHAPVAQARLHLSEQKSHALRVTIEDTEAPTAATGEGYTVSGIALQIGVKRGLSKVAEEQRG